MHENHPPDMIDKPVEITDTLNGETSFGIIRNGPPPFMYMPYRPIVPDIHIELWTGASLVPGVIFVDDVIRILEES